MKCCRWPTISEDPRAILFVLLFLLVSIALPQGSWAATVEAEVTSFVKQIYRDNDIQISFTQLPSHVKGDVRVKTVSFTKVPDAGGDGICMVGIEGKTGTEISVQVPFKVLVKKKLYVAKRDLRKGDVIRPGDMVVKESYLNGAGGVYPSAPEDVLGKVANKEIPAGETFTKQLLDDAVAVQKGEVVCMTAESKTLVVQGKGTALEKAKIGELVRVRSASGREVTGMVTGHDAVTVEF
jgi:flagella basal body P-ring formation protein FlgA